MKITTQIQGGLGNQLFQYATGKALSIRLKCPLELDIDWFNQCWDDVTPRHFLLSELKLEYQIALQKPAIQAPKRWVKIAQQFLPINPYILKERPFSFNKSINSLKPYSCQDVYLMGYWQSYRYFESIRDVLIREIRPAATLSNHYQNYLKKIDASVSAMVHVRRGDYILQPAASRIHGFLGLEYYSKGMNFILKKAPDSQFFVFSDDLQWAKEHLPFQEKITYIENSEQKDAPVQELLLMSKCKIHLIANSSLSWWGAWLKTNKSSLTICPAKWTLIEKNNFDDLLLKEWIKI